VARIRSIKPEFWYDEELSRISRDARLLYIALWNLADDHGKMRGDTRFIKGQVFPYDTDDIEPWLIELERIEKVIRYTVDGSKYLMLKNFAKHQKVDHPTDSKIPDPEDSSREILASSPEKLALEQGAGNRDMDQGGESSAGAPSPSEPVVGCIEGDLARVWRKGPGYPISITNGAKFIRAALDRGADPEKVQEVIWNHNACKGHKIWEVLDPLCPEKVPRPGERSWDEITREIIGNFNGGGEA
jgi:hypothetical protein